MVVHIFFLYWIECDWIRQMFRFKWLCGTVYRLCRRQPQNLKAENLKGHRKWGLVRNRRNTNGGRRRGCYSNRWVQHNCLFKRIVIPVFTFTAFTKFFERLMTRLSQLGSSVIINCWIWDLIRDIFIFNLNRSL